MIIPKIKVLFNLMKKYITGRLSIVDVVAYLEPFMIYTDDLTYMQYVEITNFIDPEEQMREAQMMAMKLAHEKAMSDYNPFKKEKAHAPNVLTPEEELARMKPDGSRFRFKMLDLTYPRRLIYVKTLS
jgi:hypothetical protein